MVLSWRQRKMETNIHETNKIEMSTKRLQKDDGTFFYVITLSVFSSGFNNQKIEDSIKFFSEEKIKIIEVVK